MVTAMKMSRPYTVRDLKNRAYRQTYLQCQYHVVEAPTWAADFGGTGERGGEV